MQAIRRSLPGKRSRVLQIRLVAVLIALFSLLPVLTDAAQLTGPVNRVVPPDSRPCFFFSLAGINQADPVFPGAPWIAIRQSQNGFKEIYAAILASMMSGVPLTVATTGVGVSECDGYTGVSTITLQTN